MASAHMCAWFLSATLLLFGVHNSSLADVEHKADPSKGALRPVLLIHGIKDSARRMERMARFLRNQGREAHTLSYVPSCGQVGLDESAKQIAAYVDRTFSPDQHIDLVAFSMGGLISRYYVQRLGGDQRVKHLVTISSPHRGTWAAYLIPNAGCRQMRPGSAFLRDLDSDAGAIFSRVRFTSFWTPFDLVILPAASSIVPSAKCNRLWCAAHPLMIWEPRCMRAVAQALGE